ncbi:glycosyltransferase [Bacillus solitudinis]|uniref:glycosyltransferase n=1 Tax=Bacillus solitudinis TaxID=2014074 RepID=UPI0012FE453D|nr:glycosyltransferase [Bacillus solitudinis]
MLRNGFKRGKNILFFTPYYLQSRGNATTAKRIEQGMQLAGWNVLVFAYEEEEWTEEWQRRFEEVDLYHVLHLRRFASWLMRHKLNLTKPYVLTSGGTDVNEDLKDPAAALLIKSVADESCAITVFSEDGKEKIAAVFPELAERVHVIAQSIWLPEANNRSNTTIISGYPSFLLPAGLRPVKDVFYLWEAMVELRKTYTTLSFTIIGANLDNTIYQEVKKRSENVEWFHYLGEIPLNDMTPIYKQCDIVINTSLSEGQPTSILEAMYVGKPVIARRIPGNESIIQHTKNGLLFNSTDEFLIEVKTLLNYPKKRERIVRAGQDYIQTHHQLEQEVSLYSKVYKHCIEKAQKPEVKVET